MHNIVVVVVVISLFSNNVQSRITKYCIITYTHKWNQMIHCWWYPGSRSSSSWPPYTWIAAIKTVPTGRVRGRARVQLQKFQNSLRNTYFSPLYILIYKTSWEAFDSISWSDIVSWCYWFYSIVMHHSWCLRRISYFSFDIENNFWTIQDIALLIFNKIQNITFIYVRYF